MEGAEPVHVGAGTPASSEGPAQGALALPLGLSFLINSCSGWIFVWSRELEEVVFS